jgi:hypothetical protein
MEVIFKENHRREILIDEFPWEKQTRLYYYIPTYKNKNILAWGAVSNTKGYGFNLLLIDGDDIYGDWLIMTNKNNLSIFSNVMRHEPFSFSLRELPEEIGKVQITHFYSSEFEPFNEISFINLIHILAFELK